MNPFAETIENLFNEFRAAKAAKERADARFVAARDRLIKALNDIGPGLPRNPVQETWTVGSRTRPGVRHILSRFANGNVVCSCEGFRFRKNCSHGGKVVGPTREDGSPRGRLTGLRHLL